MVGSRGSRRVMVGDYRLGIGWEVMVFLVW